MLNYILKDTNEIMRTGIYVTFNKVADWGYGRKHFLVCKVNKQNILNAKSNLQTNHLLYPTCIDLILRENQKLDEIEFFKVRKQNQYRPLNILYYLKKNMTQLTEAITFLNENWVKKIVELINKNIDLNKENITKLKQFFNSIHIIMSNKLK